MAQKCLCGRVLTELDASGWRKEDPFKGVRIGHVLLRFNCNTGFESDGCGVDTEYQVRADKVMEFLKAYFPESVPLWQEMGDEMLPKIMEDAEAYVTEYPHCRPLFRRGDK